MKEAAENKLKEEAWLQRQRNMATGVGTSKPKSLSISQEVEQHCVVIEEVDPPSEMRKVVSPFEPHQQQPVAQTSSLPLVTLNQEGTIGERA